MSSFNQTPDKPGSFGYKTSWFALRAQDPVAVIDALELGEATGANWASGLAVAYSGEDALGSGPWLFVSPPVSGWVLAVSMWLPYPAVAADRAVEGHDGIGQKFDMMFSRLMRRFDDVQFFGNHRVSDFCAWARALKGKPTRVFAYADGQVLMNLGAQTPDEAKLGLADLTGLSPSDAGDKIFKMADEQDATEDTPVESGDFGDEAEAGVRRDDRCPFPDESDVIELAGLWSIDPTQLSDQDHPNGSGLAVRLPEKFRQ